MIEELVEDHNITRTAYKWFTVLDIEGTKYLETNNVTNEESDSVKDSILTALQRTQGYSNATKMHRKVPFDILIGCNGRIIREFADYGVGSECVSEYLSIINPAIEEQKRMIQYSTENDAIEFNNLIYIFEPGTEVYAYVSDEPVGGIVRDVERISSFFGIYYSVNIEVIHNLGGSVARDNITSYIPYYKGTSKMADLPIRVINDEDKLQLAARGRVFQKVARDHNFMHYTGEMTRNSYYNTRRYRATGRVMVDSKSFGQIDPDQFRNEQYFAGFQVGRADKNSISRISDIPEEDLWMTYPFVYGFSFAVKQWGAVRVSGLTDIEYREDSFDKLVLDAEDKELVRAVVEYQGSSFSDIIDGKGGGSIFLLHGPPGQGKTLTAEATAELLHRPLYSVSVGELGTDPSDLEHSLREILDMATLWDAVLLLDEADIFLEKRDEHDILRNAMVGVFLRLLEYHQGVLFLTTNRVNEIDPAFFSRISVALRFEEATTEKKARIWSNLLNAANIFNIDVAVLANNDLNGRQIKNTIRLCQTLSKAHGVDIDTDMILNTITMTNKFAASLKQ